MHPQAAIGEVRGGVFDGVTRYHWLVVVIASCGWLFDCMDQRLFILAREPALRELIGQDPQAAEHIKTFSGYATTSMILGWATGGIIFGMMSDRLGRVRTMVVTLLIYSGFTGLSGLAQSWVDFTLYRFLVGLGVGGMFGAATTLVAESVPGQFRAMALGSLQALSALGNIIGSLVSLVIPPGAENYLGIVQRLARPVLRRHRACAADRADRVRAEGAGILAAREGRGGGRPERSTKTIGSPFELFRDPRWRHNTIIGLLLGVSGMIGLWGIGFFSPELISTALQGASQTVVDRVRALGTALQDVGAFFGMVTFTLVAAFISRRLAFLGALLLSMGVTMFVFTSLESANDAYWMLPMMGFAQLAVFAGYSIYFPELFPTRLRGTGVGFCYNTVRYLAAPAPILLGYLATQMSFRRAAVMMSTVYVVGMVALIWAPETKGKPLPED